MKDFLRRGRDACRAFLRRQPALREATVYPDDVFLVSYSKSGNTWLRFLLGNLAFGDNAITFADIEQRMPSIYESTDRQMKLASRPRYIKSHEAFHSRYQNVIYIVRDPRDVAVSYYHYTHKMRKMPADSVMDGFVQDFINGHVRNPEGLWADHVMSWLAMQHSRKSFLLVRYVDLIEDPFRELSRVAAFLQLPAEKEKINRAILLSTADRMRELEKQEWKKWKLTKGSRGETPFVRAAKANQWQTVLSPQSVMAIEAAWGPVMQAVGYKLANDPASLAAASDSWARWEAQVRVLWPPRLGVSEATNLQFPASLTEKFQKTGPALSR